MKKTISILLLELRSTFLVTSCGVKGAALFSGATTTTETTN